MRLLASFLTLRGRLFAIELFPAGHDCQEHKKENTSTTNCKQSSCQLRTGSDSSDQGMVKPGGICKSGSTFDRHGHTLSSEIWKNKVKKNPGNLKIGTELSGKKPVFYWQCVRTQVPGYQKYKKKRTERYFKSRKKEVQLSVGPPQTRRGVLSRIRKRSMNHSAEEETTSVG